MVSYSSRGDSSSAHSPSDPPPVEVAGCRKTVDADQEVQQKISRTDESSVVAASKIVIVWQYEPVALIQSNQQQDHRNAETSIKPKKRKGMNIYTIPQKPHYQNTASRQNNPSRIHYSQRSVLGSISHTRPMWHISCRRNSQLGTLFIKAPCISMVSSAEGKPAGQSTDLHVSAAMGG